MRKRSPGQCFVTTHDLGAFREHISSNDEDSVPIGWFRGHTKIGSVLEVKVTNHSLKNDGSHSWIVISRGMNKYVEELYEENGDSIHYEEMATGMSKPLRQNTRGPSSPPSQSFSMTFVPND